MLWDLAETGVTIIAASIPALRVLFRQVRRGTKMDSNLDRYTLSNLKRSKAPKPTCLDSQNDDNFDKAHYISPTAGTRSDKGILETRVMTIERHQVDEKNSACNDPW